MFRLAAQSTRTVTAPALCGSARHFHQSPIAANTLKEKVEKVAHDVNMGIGKGMASAIDKGEELTEAAKEKLGAATQKTKQEANKAGAASRESLDETKSQADRAAQYGKQKMNQAAAGAREAKDDFQKELSK